MGLLEKLRENKVFKIIFSIILLVIILGIISLYYGFQKFVLQNEIENPFELIKKYTNKNNENFK